MGKQENKPKQKAVEKKAPEKKVVEKEVAEKKAVKKEVVEQKPFDVNSISREAFGVEAWIPLSDLEIDLQAQRNLMDGQVKKIIKEFNPSAIGRIIVTKQKDKDGKHHIQDGQHRVEALRILGFKEAPCVLVDAENTKQEAENFLLINLSSAPVSSLDKYRIGVSANVPEYLNIKECLDHIGVQAGNGTGKVSAVASIGSYINAPSKDEARAKKRATMKNALDILKDTAGIDLINQTSILGMCIFCKHFVDTGHVEKEEVIEKFNHLDITGLIKQAQTMKNNSTRGKVVSYLAWLLAEEYNKSVKGRKKLINNINVNQ